MNNKFDKTIDDIKNELKFDKAIIKNYIYGHEKVDCFKQALEDYTSKNIYKFFQHSLDENMSSELLTEYNHTLNNTITRLKECYSNYPEYYGTEQPIIEILNNATGCETNNQNNYSFNWFIAAPIMAFIGVSAYFCYSLNRLSVAQDYDLASN